MMSCQAQSVSGLISHLPFCDPPQGPFNSFLAQRVTGQIPPKMSSLQFPQPDLHLVRARGHAVGQAPAEPLHVAVA